MVGSIIYTWWTQRVFVCANCWGMMKTQSINAKCIRCNGIKAVLREEHQELKERHTLYLSVKDFMWDDRDKWVKTYGYDWIIFNGSYDIAKWRWLPSSLRRIKKWISNERLANHDLLSMLLDAKNWLPISWWDMINAITSWLVDFKYEKRTYIRNPKLTWWKPLYISPEREITRKIRKFANLIVRIWEWEVDADDYADEFDLSIQLDCTDEINYLIWTHLMDVKKIPKLYNHFKTQLEKDTENSIIQKPYAT